MNMTMPRLLAGMGLAAAVAGSVLVGGVAHAAPSTGVLRVVGVGSAPNAVAVDARANRAFVVNSGENTVSVLDARTGLVTRTVHLGKTLASLNNSAYLAAADEATGRVFVVAQGHPPAASRVSVLDAATGRVLRTTTAGVFAMAVAVDELTNRVFVTNLDSNSVSVLDARTGTTLRTVAIGKGPSGIAVAESSGHAFVVNEGGTISMLDARTGAVVRTVTTDQQAAGFAVAAAGRVFVFHQSGHVTILDAATGSRLRTVRLGRFPGAAAFDAGTGRVFVANTGINGSGRTVTILNGRTGATVRTVSVGRGPMNIVVDAGTRRAFVANYAGNSVSVLNADSGAVLRTVASPNPFTVALDAQTHRVFAVNFSRPHMAGSVTVIDARA